MKKVKPAQGGTAADPEMAEFEAALLRSLDQAARGEGRVTTPEQTRPCVWGVLQAA